MAIETSWYQPGAILLIRLSGDLTPEDLRAALEATRDAHQQTLPGQPLHTITDVTQLGKIPLKLTEVTNTLSGLRESKATGWAIVISDGNPLVHFMMTAIAQLFSFRMRLFPTLEAGIAFLHEMDDNLSAT